MSNPTLFQEGLLRRRNPKRRPKLRQHRGRNRVNIGTAATTTTSVMLPPPSTTTTTSKQKSGTATISSIRKLFLQIRLRPPLFPLPPPLIRRRVRLRSRSRSIPIPRRWRREGRLLSNTAQSGSWSQGWSSGEQSKIKTGSII